MNSTIAKRSGSAVLKCAATSNAVDLDQLAQRINDEHEKANAAFEKGLGHALTAGQLLLEAKSKVKHGEWLDWLRDNCTVSERSAQLYMRTARQRPALEAKTASLADLSLERAASLLAKPRQHEAPLLPSISEAREIARATGKAQIATDGRIYTGMTAEESEQFLERRDQFFLIFDAIETLAKAKELDADDFIAGSEPHLAAMLNKERMNCAIEWLQRLGQAVTAGKDLA